MRGGGSATAEPDALSGFVSVTGLAGMPVEEARQINDREAAVMFGPVEPVFSVEDKEIAGGLRARIYRPDATTKRTLVYFHGGGWVVGSLNSHDGVARFLCRFGRCVVAAVDYSLAPEHRFPAAVEDAWAATEWFARDAMGLAVGGDSAGGNLAAVVARHARDHGLGLVMQLLAYPVLDCTTAVWEENSGWWLQQYLRTETDALDPDASPLRAPDLRGVAPASILSCGLDPLRTQADLYATRLREAGVAADHICFEGLIHGAYRMPAVLDAAREMLAASAAALDEAFNRR